MDIRLDVSHVRILLRVYEWIRKENGESVEFKSVTSVFNEYKSVTDGR